MWGGSRTSCWGPRSTSLSAPRRWASRRSSTPASGTAAMTGTWTPSTTTITPRLNSLPFFKWPRCLELSHFYIFIFISSCFFLSSIPRSKHHFNILTTWRKRFILSHWIFKIIALSPLDDNIASYSIIFLGVWLCVGWFVLVLQLGNQSKQFVISVNLKHTVKQWSNSANFFPFFQYQCIHLHIYNFIIMINTYVYTFFKQQKVSFWNIIKEWCS